LFSLDGEWTIYAHQEATGDNHRFIHHLADHLFVAFPRFLRGDGFDHVPARAAASIRSRPLSVYHHTARRHDASDVRFDRILHGTRLQESSPEGRPTHSLGGCVIHGFAVFRTRLLVAFYLASDPERRDRLTMRWSERRTALRSTF